MNSKVYVCLILTNLCALITSSLLSQTRQIMGTVTDSIENPIPYANIILKPLNLKHKKKFTITDEDGFYKLSLVEGRYAIEVSHLGFLNHSDTLSIKKKLEYNLVLKENVSQLDEVIVEPPLIVKKDTIVYTTDYFKDGSERKMKNVLKKLPGVEIDRSGKIFVMGKKVDKLLVEGKEFFGGGIKLALENIPANALEKIELLDNYTEHSFLKDISDSNVLALNVKLKKDKKTFVFGEVGGGYGNQSFYEAKTSFFQYNPKNEINIIANSNNIGETPITAQDYIRFEGGLENFSNSKSVIKKSLRNNLTRFLINQDYVQSRSNFGGINYSLSLGEKVSVLGLGLISDLQSTSQRNSTNSYSTYDAISNEKFDSDNLVGVGRLTFEFKPSAKENWKATTFIEKANNEQVNNILRETTILEQDRKFTTDYNNNNLFINQTLEAHKRLSKKHTFSLGAVYSFEDESPFTTWTRNDTLSSGLIPLVADNAPLIEQDKKIRNNTIEIILKHYWVLNARNHIYTTLGNAYTNQIYNTEDRQVLSNGNINNFSNENFGNQLDYTLNDSFLGLHYKFRLGLASFKQGGYFRSYKWRVKQESNVSESKLFFFPEFESRFDFKKSDGLLFNYKMQTEFPGVENYAENFYLTSFNSVFQGNPNIENSIFHTFNLSYKQNRLLRGISWITAISHNIKSRFLMNVFNNIDDNFYQTPRLINDFGDDWLFSGRAETTSSKLRYVLRGEYVSTRFVQQDNENLNKNSSNKWKVGLWVQNTHENLPTLKLGFNHSIGNYQNGNQKALFKSTEPFANLDYDFLGGFILSYDYSFFKYKTDTLTNEYQLSNILLTYQGDNSPWEFKIDARNIFNENFKQSNSISEFVITDRRIFIQPLSIIFSLGYKF